jgi:hypothetical protein
MMTFKVIRCNPVLLAALLGVAAQHAARADFIPTHGDVVHQNPFVPFWPVPPVFLPPLKGSVVPGDGNPSNPSDYEYDVVARGSTCDIIPGNDALFSPAGWHWEVELDFNPYGPVGGAFISFFGAPPVPVPFRYDPTDPTGNWDVRIDIHQPDWIAPVGLLHLPPTPQNPIGGTACVAGLPSGADTGSFDKALWNLTPLTLAWGTSVTENLTIQGFAIGRTILFPDGRELFVPSPVGHGDEGALIIEGDPINGLFVGKIPEPATPALIVLGWLLTCRTRQRMIASCDVR